MVKACKNSKFYYNEAQPGVVCKHQYAADQQCPLCKQEHEAACGDSLSIGQHVYVNPYAKNNPFRIAVTCRITEINGDIIYVHDLAEKEPIFTVIKGEFQV